MVRHALGAGIGASAGHAEQVTLGPDAHLDGGQLGDDLVGDGPVDGEVVLPEGLAWGRTRTAGLI
jgi:hypothetical protein